VSIEVIGAGFGRTGTLTLKAALEQLGFAPCYHYVEVVERRPGRNDGHLRAWVDFAKGRREMDWRWLLRSYRAVLDFPMCSFYAELLAAFPDARVILTLRDPESWFRSFEGLYTSLRRMRLGALFAPRLRATATIFEHLVKRRVFGGRLGREACLEAFERHRCDVIASVPAERLLVYDVRQGWGPLCSFLARPDPDVPFPHLNEGEDLAGRMARSLLLGEDDLFTGR
jgi:hypothetical protein